MTSRFLAWEIYCSRCLLAQRVMPRADALGRLGRGVILRGGPLVVSRLSDLRPRLIERHIEHVLEVRAPAPEVKGDGRMEQGRGAFEQ